jgi:hypothetical protein
MPANMEKPQTRPIAANIIRILPFHSGERSRRKNEPVDQGGIACSRHCASHCASRRPRERHATEKCDIADSELEEAIAKKPEFRAPANRQLVRDLRSLRDAAFILWSYGRLEDCNRLMANIRELVFAPAMGSLGGTDEDEVNYQTAASQPFVHRGGAVEGRRGDVGAKALVSINELVPGLRADEIIGTEVRSSDDKIIGEVRNFVFGTKEQARLRGRGLGRFLYHRQGQLRGPDPSPQCQSGPRQLLSADYRGGREDRSADAGPRLCVACRRRVAGGERRALRIIPAVARESGDER